MKKARIIQIRKGPYPVFRVYEGRDGMGPPALDQRDHPIEGSVIPSVGDTVSGVIHILAMEAIRNGYDVADDVGYREVEDD